MGLKENSESESVWSLSKNEMMVGPDPQTLRVLVTPVSLGPTGPDALTNLKTVQADFWAGKCQYYRQQTAPPLSYCSKDVTAHPHRSGDRPGHPWPAPCPEAERHPSKRSIDHVWNASRFRKRYDMTRQLVTAKTETDGELGGTMTRNNGGWMPPSLLLLKLKTRPTETSGGFSAGFTLCLQGISSRMYRYRYTPWHPVPTLHSACKFSNVWGFCFTSCFFLMRRWHKERFPLPRRRQVQAKVTQMDWKSGRIKVSDIRMCWHPWRKTCQDQGAGNERTCFFFMTSFVVVVNALSVRVTEGVPLAWNNTLSPRLTTTRVVSRKLVIYSFVHHPFSPWKSNKKFKNMEKSTKKSWRDLLPAPPERDPWNLCLQGKWMVLTLHSAYLILLSISLSVFVVGTQVSVLFVQKLVAWPFFPDGIMHVT